MAAPRRARGKAENLQTAQAQLAAIYRRLKEDSVQWQTLKLILDEYEPSPKIRITSARL